MPRRARPHRGGRRWRLLPLVPLATGALVAQAAPPGAPLVVAIVDDAFEVDDPRLAALWAAPSKEVPSNGVDDDRNGFVDDVRGWDVVDRDADVRAPVERADELRHGTALALVIAEAASHAFGEGAAQRIRLLPVKTVADSAPNALIRHGYAGIAYALDAGADVILCAWSGVHLQPEERLVLERAQAAGVLVIGAAGNLGSLTPNFPAAHPSVVSVVARDTDGRRLPRSSFGGTADLSASARPLVLSEEDAQDVAGTSGAAALVAGAAAVAWSEHPEWSADEVRAALWATADAPAHDDTRSAASMGAGVLNAEALREGSPWTPRSLWTRSVGALPLVSGKAPTSFSIAAPGEVHKVSFALQDVGSSGAGARTAMVSLFAGRNGDAAAVWSGPLGAFPTSVEVPGRRAYVRLEPGRGKLRALLTYRADPVDVARKHCRDVVELSAPGAIADGSGDAPYSPASDCRWVITAPEGQRVRFFLDALDTEAAVDQLHFFHGGSTAGEPIAALSGAEGPAEFTSWGRQVTLWWVTNEAVEAGGWALHFTFEPRPPVEGEAHEAHAP